jgi:hypothetical protein
VSRALAPSIREMPFPEHGLSRKTWLKPKQGNTHDLPYRHGGADRAVNNQACRR